MKADHPAFNPSCGLTKRELFAAMAMQGMAASAVRGLGGTDDFSLTLAFAAVRCADALIVMLAKEQS